MATYGERKLKEVIDTEAGEMTIKALISKASKAKDNGKKNSITGMICGPMQEVVTEMILSLPKGARSLDSLFSEVCDVYGSNAALHVDQKLLAGLSVEFPKLVSVSFTLGLQEVVIK